MDLSRRKFIKNSLTATTGASLVHTIPGTLLASKKEMSLNDKINVSLVGCKDHGFNILKLHVKQPNVECVALCDVDNNILQEKASEIEKLTGKKPKLFKDYRKMLEEKGIDAVIIGTPDHWHCLIMVAACETGKDVYVEKPMANSIEECNIMVKAAKKYNRIVQVGQQQRSAKHWRQAMELIHSGEMGKIRKVKYWANFNYGKGTEVVPDEPVPDGVDFDFWLGPAPERPFNRTRFHGYWRMFWDYGGGLMTDWGVHLIDMGIWALNLTAPPKSTMSIGGNFAEGNNSCETADTQTVLYEFDNYHMVWDQNGGIETGPYGRIFGIEFIGENGTLIADRDNWVVFPEGLGDSKRMKDIPQHESEHRSHEDHVINFLECIRSRNKPACDVEIGRLAAIYAHLGNIAYRTGEKVVYDMNENVFKESSKAESFRIPEYRKPWVLPKL